MARLTTAHIQEFGAIKALCYRGLSSSELRERIGERLARHLGLASYCFGSTDPVTALPVHSLSVGLDPGAMQSFFKLVLATPALDFGRWLGSGQRVARLETLVADVERDPYFREILRPSGLRHDLQVACTADGWSWGHLCLRRAEGASAFAGHELRFLEALVPHLTMALRAAAGESARSATHATLTGIVVLGPEGSVELANAAAERLFRLPTSGTRHNFLTAVHIAAAQLERCLSAPGQGSETVPQVLFTDELSRTTYRLRAERVLGADGRARGLVHIEPAATRVPSEQLALLARFGLARRECEVAVAVLKGLPTDRIASELAMSPHTVSDHLRRVFDRVGVHSRQQLAMRLLGGA